MDAHDELFYRLNDPDPHTQVTAELKLIGTIFSGNFVERWLEWNGFEYALREWRTARPLGGENGPMLSEPSESL